MLPRTTIAPVNGWSQGGPNMALCQHTFETTPDGQIMHLTDGELRAVIPPEGWAAYAEAWPVVGELAAGLQRAPATAASPADAALAAASAALAATIPGASPA